MSISVLWSVALLALFCEYVDSTLGMGYGTTLTPILLLMGYEPVQVVPSVLLSEFLTGILAGFLHQGLGNVSFKPGTRPFKATLVLAACSVVGTLIAVFVAVNIPTWMLKTYIGLLVLAMGVTILLTMNRTFAFSWRKLAGLGLVAALNKGLSGGGTARSSAVARCLRAWAKRRPSASRQWRRVWCVSLASSPTR